MLNKVHLLNATTAEALQAAHKPTSTGFYHGHSKPYPWILRLLPAPVFRLGLFDPHLSSMAGSTIVRNCPLYAARPIDPHLSVRRHILTLHLIRIRLNVIKKKCTPTICTHNKRYNETLFALNAICFERANICFVSNPKTTWGISLLGKIIWRPAIHIAYSSTAVFSSPR